MLSPAAAAQTLTQTRVKDTLMHLYVYQIRKHDITCDSRTVRCSTSPRDDQNIALPAEISYPGD
jgi:hypothetical protein